MTCAILRYPAHFIDVLQLANGRRITIRPTLPQDAELQRAFFHSLSAEARYFRFMTHFSKPPEALIERFTSIDYRNHLALLAEVFENGCEIMIGEARYVVDAGDPAACEFAICVADDWHVRGIGRALLDRLERQAATSGIQRMAGDTLLVNKAMVEFARRAGYAIVGGATILPWPDWRRDWLRHRWPSRWLRDPHHFRNDGISALTSCCSSPRKNLITHFRKPSSCPTTQTICVRIQGDGHGTQSHPISERSL